MGWPQFRAGEATLLFEAHNMMPACHPCFDKMAPCVCGDLRLGEGPIVQAIVPGVEAGPAALRELFERGPVAAKADKLAMDDLSVLAASRPDEPGDGR